MAFQRCKGNQKMSRLLDPVLQAVQDWPESSHNIHFEVERDFEHAQVLRADPKARKFSLRG